MLELLKEKKKKKTRCGYLEIVICIKTDFLT